MDEMRVGQLTVLVDSQLGHLIRIFQKIAAEIDVEMHFDIPARLPSGAEGRFDVDLPYDDPTWSRAPDAPSPHYTGFAIRRAKAFLREKLTEQANAAAQREAAGEMAEGNICPVCRQHEVTLRFEPPRIVMLCPEGHWEDDRTPEDP